MRAARTWHWLRRLPGACIAVVLAGIASTPLWGPTIAAAACPGCYGMHQIAGDVFVDDSMPENRQRELKATIATSEATVTAFFGELSARRVILACGNEACEDRLRGWLEGPGRVRAMAYDAGLIGAIRLSPRGQNVTLVTHELSHAQLHAQIGFFTHMLGRFPAWFDEGLAVLISDDRRYFKPGQTAAERCLPTPDAALPSLPTAWTEMQGRSEWIYAKAACRVMQWMEANGGRAGVLAAIADVRIWKPFRP